jgi:AraC-like DNA-binding protein
MFIARCASPREQLGKGMLTWHRHDRPILAVLKRGSYVEHVLRGRFVVTHGLAVLNPPFAPHCDEIGIAGARVCNVIVGDRSGGLFELPRSACAPGWPHHPDEVTDALPDLKPVAMNRHESWIEHALHVLIGEGNAAAAARAVGLSREHFHRRFCKALRLTPGQFLREYKMTEALASLRAGKPIAQVANDCGFADQSHMTRLVRLVTGFAPGRFQRGQVTPVQD